MKAVTKLSGTEKNSSKKVQLWKIITAENLEGVNKSLKGFNKR